MWLNNYILITTLFVVFLGAVLQNQILYETCVTIMHYNESDCEPLLGNDRGSEATKVSVIIYIYIIYINVDTKNSEASV